MRPDNAAPEAASPSDRWEAAIRATLAKFHHGLTDTQRARLAVLLAPDRHPDTGSRTRT